MQKKECPKCNNCKPKLLGIDWNGTQYIGRYECSNEDKAYQGKAFEMVVTSVNEKWKVKRVVTK